MTKITISITAEMAPRWGVDSLVERLAQQLCDSMGDVLAIRNIHVTWEGGGAYFAITDDEGLDLKIRELK